MAVSPIWVNEWNKMLWEQAAWKGWQKEPFRVNCTWTISKGSTQLGELPAIRSGGSSFWSTCFTMWQLCGGRIGKDMQEDVPMCKKLTWLKKWPQITPPSGPFWGPLPRRFWVWQTKCTRGVHTSPKWTPPPATRGIYGRATSGADLPYD